MTVHAFALPNGTRVEIGEEPTGSWTRVVLPDGAEIYGEPQRNEEQAQTAERLGYGSDVDRMCRDHDPLHAWLCSALGLSTSYSLSDAAGTLDPNNRPLAELEERAVLAVQEFMVKAGGRAPWPANEAELVADHARQFAVDAIAIDPKAVTQVAECDEIVEGETVRRVITSMSLTIRKPVSPALACGGTVKADTLLILGERCSDQGEALGAELAGRIERAVAKAQASAIRLPSRA